MTPDEPEHKSKIGDGRIAVATADPDGSGWIGWDSEGRRIQFCDLDDYEVMEALWRYPFEREPVR